MSQKAAGAAMGVSQSTYNRIERNGTTNLDHIDSLAEVLKVSRLKMIRVMDEISEG